MDARKLIIKGLTFIAGLFFLLEFLIPGSGEAEQNFLTPYLPGVNNFVIVVAAMALLLGPINLVRSHIKKIAKKNKGWSESIVFLVFLVFGILAKVVFEKYDATKVLYNISFYGILMAFGTSSMGLLSFYLISAAYRSFRFNNLESGVMMLSAMIVLLGLVPLGNWITGGLPSTFHLSTCTSWILSVPNTAVQRAVLIGAVGGAFAAGLRQWLGLGRTVE